MLMLSVVTVHAMIPYIRLDSLVVVSDSCSLFVSFSGPRGSTLSYIIIDIGIPSWLLASAC